MTKQVSSVFGFRKFFAYLMTIFFIATISACSAGKFFQMEDHLGLYKLVDKTCSVPDKSFNPCDSTYFIELVKGQFFGIKDSEIAYVFWSGDPKIDPELQYTAQLIQNHSTIKLIDNKYWLGKNSNIEEYFGFSKDKLSHYYVKRMVGKNMATRTIKYTLIPAIRSSEPHFRLNYPGNK